MFNTKDLDLDIIRNRARDQLLDGTFPSLSGSPDYDDFVRSVIDEEAKIILGLSGVMKLEDVHDYKSRASEFLTELLATLDTSFIEAIKKIKDFAEHKPEESPDDSKLVQVARIRKAHHYLRVLGTPWFKAIMEPDQYQELLEKLKIIGKQ
jgi:hypothetical protein